MLFLFSLLRSVGCGWLPRLSAVILRNANDPGFESTGGIVAPFPAGFRPVSESDCSHFGPLCRDSSTGHPQGSQHPSDCPVVWASPPNRIPVSVQFGNLGMLELSFGSFPVVQQVFRLFWVMEHLVMRTGIWMLPCQPAGCL